MKSHKKLLAIIAVAMVANWNYSNTTYAIDNREATLESLIGAKRYDTAVKISDKGWQSGSLEAVIVNDSAISDAISVTPYAYLKNAPILLTEKDVLNETTKAQLKKLGVNKVYLVGGTNVITENVETELKKMNIVVDRVAGSTREYTSLEIAKRINEISPVTEIAYVNGYSGLADAVSIASFASTKHMPIFLSGSDGASNLISQFIKDKSISNSYIIGGTTVIPSNIEKSLPNVSRISGLTRRDTNAEVIKTFYSNDEISNVFVSKDGALKMDQLIDALSVGVLAAKENSPVMIVSNELSKTQADVVNTKSFEKMTQVGGAGNETAFNQLASIQKESIYNVKTISELKNALEKCDANDKIVMNATTRSTIDENIEVVTEKKINIDFYGDYKGAISLNMPNGSVSNKGSMEKLIITSNGTVTSNGIDIFNEGQIKSLEIKDRASGYIENKVGGIITNVDIAANVSKVEIDNKGTVDNIKNDSTNVVINNSGTISGGNSGETEEEVPPVVVDKEVEAVIEDINKIPENLTLTHEEIVIDAKNKYDALSQEQKEKVTNIEKLTSAINKINAIKEEIRANEVAAKEVVDEINKLPEEILLSHKKTVEDTLELYNGLTVSQKILVSNKSKLDIAVAQLDEKIKEEEIRVENVSKAEEVLVEISKLPEESNLEISHREQVLKVKQMYNDLSEEAKLLVPEDKVDVLNNTYNKMMEMYKEEMDRTSAELVVSNIQKLDKEIKMGDKAEITSVRQAYNELSNEAKDLVTNLSILVDAEGKLQVISDKIIAVSRKISLIEKEDITLEDKANAIAAREAYETLNEDEKRYIASTQKSYLITVELEIHRLETIEANPELKKVIELIEAIPEADLITEENRSQVETARNKYNALNDSLKFAVDITKLVNAEAKFK